jgi:hypothetical protein
MTRKNNICLILALLAMIPVAIIGGVTISEDAQSQQLNAAARAQPEPPAEPWSETSLDYKQSFGDQIQFRIGVELGGNLSFGSWVTLEEGTALQTRLLIQTRAIASPEPPGPPEPPEPPQTGNPAWWPPQSAIDARAADAREVNAAIQAVDGVGGFITLTTEEAVDAFVDKMVYGGAVEGAPDRRVVIRLADGLRISQPMKNVKSEWKHLCFDGVLFQPDTHTNKIAISLHGDHDYNTFLNCTFRDWEQVAEGQDDAVGNEPDHIVFQGGLWEDIYNSNSPVVNYDNQNDEDHRSQGVWWQGSGWQFKGVTARGVGWNRAGDPNRMRTDKFSQILYGSQKARNTTVEDCVFEGTSNNAIVMKGWGLTVRGCTFDQVVNAVSFGTNQNQQQPCDALIENCEIKRLIPLNWKDDGSLPRDEQVAADSGVAFSFLNFNGVTIRNVRVTGENTGRRNSFLYFNNGKSSNVEALGALVESCDAGPMRLAEVRNFRLPTGGLELTVRNTQSGGQPVLVRNTIPADDPAEILSKVTIDGDAPAWE